MKNSWKFLFVAIIGLGLLIGPPGDAYAKRLGGGKSFGGRPSYSQPYRPAPDYGATRSAPSAMPSPVQRNQAMRDSFRSRGGLMGMLGGLALGGLLGSMLFGGAFEHINFLDILIFGVVAYLGFRLLAARRGAPQWDTGRGNAGVADGRFARVEPNDPRHASHGSAPAGFDTDVMFRGGHGGRSSAGAMDVPAGFDHAAFISGAKQAYRHLQKAWDNRDYAELRALTTDHVYAELEAQLRASGATDDTEVMALDAQLLGVERAEGRSLANVLFTAKVREGAVSGASTIREVWHFTRSDDSRQPTWYLDGLQQVDE